MAKVDLRKLKDQATKAVEKKQYEKAAELYVEIGKAEPGDPDWHQRAGEAFRKVPDGAQAVREMELAAEGYAKGGFLLKAIAVCKVVLAIDPKHTSTQVMLADLYAKREGRPAASPMAASPRAMPSAAAKPIAPVAAPPRPVAPVAAPKPITPAASVAGPPAVDAPLDALPLAQIFKAPRSQQFSVAALAQAAAAAAEPAAYEIELAYEDEPAAAEDAPVAIAVADDETDFSDLMADAPAPPPQPALPKIPLLSSLGADDLRYVIERVAVRDCDPRDVIMRQGSEGGSLFVIVSGRVQVVSEKPMRELASLGEGAFFGELALLTNFPRSATVVAVEPTQLLEISRDLVSEIVRRSPEVLKTLLRFFRDRLLDRLLGSSPMFSSFAPEEARALADRFLFLELEPGMRVITEGERAPGMFLLLCGDARVARGAAEVARLSPGDVFGEMSLLLRKPASATIETRTKCWALELPRDRFQEVMLSYPQMLEYVSNIADARQQQNLAGAESRVDFL
ncbi:MAG TPA: cyclic nucleotide-binding domain-containing protein [Polyangia bacterium]